jgi:hypothetical protein
MYVQAAAGAAKIVRDLRVSIMPEYSSLSGSVLPRYAQIGKVVVIPEVEIKGDPSAPERKAAMMAGALFFTGLALGYIWGGTTGGVRAS